MVSGLPAEVFEYEMCSKFGWTIEQLYAQPEKKLARFHEIMRIEKTQQKLREQSNG